MIKLSGKLNQVSMSKDREPGSLSYSVSLEIELMGESEKIDNLKHLLGQMVDVGVDSQPAPAPVNRLPYKDPE